MKRCKGKQTVAAFGTCGLLIRPLNIPKESNKHYGYPYRVCMAATYASQVFPNTRAKAFSLNSITLSLCLAAGRLFLFRTRPARPHSQINNFVFRNKFSHCRHQIFPLQCPLFGLCSASFVLQRRLLVRCCTLSALW